MTPSIRSSRFASSIAMIGFLPPSSSPTLIIFFAALSYTCLPVSTPPVKEIARMSGWATRPSPTTEPVPVTRFTTPAGKPASSSTSTNLAAQRGVRLEGFRTNEQPAIRAAPLFHAGIAIGKFQGVIRPTGPTGRRAVRGLSTPAVRLAGGRVVAREQLPPGFPPPPADEEAVLLDHRRRQGKQGPVRL